MDVAAPVEVLVNDRAGHAESPLWSPAERALYWIDTRVTGIFRYQIDSGKRDRWVPASRLGAIGARRGGLVVAEKNGISLLDVATGTFAPLVDPEPTDAHSRINDAKVDRAGRFWVGYQQDYGKTPTGNLYSVDRNGTVNAVDAGYFNPNGFAWSLDDRRMYVTDTPRRTIYVYDFDPAAGAATNRRTFAQIPADEGTPDGTTVDSADYVWSAQRGGRIVRYAPDGSIDRVFELPASLLTNMTFGGDDLRTLYITTAWAGLDQEQFWTQPLAGAILSIRVDVPGVPEPIFAG